MINDLRKQIDNFRIILDKEQRMVQRGTRNGWKVVMEDATYHRTTNSPIQCWKFCCHWLLLCQLLHKVASVMKIKWEWNYFIFFQLTSARFKNQIWMTFAMICNSGKVIYLSWNTESWNKIKDWFLRWHGSTSENIPANLLEAFKNVILMYILAFIDYFPWDVRCLSQVVRLNAPQL